jgi:4-amino-4-deoxy-L-arabinose transferase-like glycosyltransferase
MRRRAAIVFVVGIVWTTAYALWQRAHEDDAWGEEPAIARHIALGHGFASPAADGPEAPPTAWSPPAYPYLAAGIFAVLGIDTPAARLALVLVNTLAMSAAAAGLVVLAGRMFGPRVGVVAGAIFLAHPIILVHVLFLWDTCLALALFLWLLAWAQSLGASPPSPGRAALMGAGLGVLCLINSSYALALPLVALLALGTGPGATRLRALGCLGAAFIVVLLPWTIRNWLVFDRLMFVRGGISVELWLGNVPGSDGLTYNVLRHHPLNAQGERESWLSLREPGYYDLCQSRFLADYQADPLAFWRRSARRVIHLALGDPKQPQDCPLLPTLRMGRWAVGHIVLSVVVAAMAAWGIVRAWRRGRWGLWPLLAGLLAVSPFIFTHVHDRYALPLRAMMVLYAAVALAKPTTVRPSVQDPPPSGRPSEEAARSAPE